MSSGPQRPFVSVKFAPVGRTYTFLLPDLAFDAPSSGDDAESQPVNSSSHPDPLSPGDAVVVTTEEGPAVATVTRTVSALASRKRPDDESPQKVVRRATRDDVLLRLKHEQREREAHRI